MTLTGRPEIRDRKSDRRDTPKAGAPDPRKEIFGIREIFGTRPSLHLTDEQRAQRFWLGEVYTLVFGFWVVSLSSVGYAVLTLHQPHRYLIMANFVFAISLAAACYGLRYRIVTLSWRFWFFGAWTSSAYAILTFACVLDGGVNSLLTFFWLLPMVYLASGYPPRMVQITGGVGILSYGVLLACTDPPMPVTRVLLQTTGLFVGWIMALSGAANRKCQDSESRQLRERLEQLAITDDLTGCLNQRAFGEALDRGIERVARYGQSLALLTIDIDHFKQINDNHGHLMGDEVLRQIGLSLRRTARESDIAGRPGGDELALLAPEAKPAEARALAARLHHDIEALKIPVAVTLSIGICVSSPDAEPAATLFRRADQALYEAKRRGRNQTVVFAEQPVAKRDVVQRIRQTEVVAESRPGL